MKQLRTIVVKLPLMFLVVVVLAGCQSPQERRQTNIDYLKGVLGALAIEYYEQFGEYPFSIEEAMSKLNRRLSHRGDAFGGSMTYLRAEKKGGTTTGFTIVAYGPNGTFDGGLADDIVLHYSHTNPGDGWIHNTSGYSFGLERPVSGAGVVGGP